MPAPKREQFKNDSFTTLDGGINNSVTSIDVADGSVFPSTGNFRLRIDDELLLCTAVSSDTLTVIRGVEGSIADSHGDSSNVVHIITDESVNRLVKDSVVLAGDDSLVPPLNTIADDNGDRIDSTDFSWFNQNAAAVTDQHGTIVMRVPATSGDSLRVQQLTAPSAPYSYVAAFQACAFRSGAGGTVPNFGFGFRDNSSGKMVTIMVLIDATSGQRLQVSNLNSETSFNSNLTGRDNFLIVGSAVWFKIENDNTNVKFYFSADGIEWSLLASVGKTAFTSSLDRVFWFANNPGNTSGADLLVRLVHWSRAS